MFSLFYIFRCNTSNQNIHCKKPRTVMSRFVIPLCKHVVPKVTLVPCPVNLTGKRDKGGHGGATMNNARIINYYLHTLPKHF